MTAPPAGGPAQTAGARRGTGGNNPQWPATGPAGVAGIPGRSEPPGHGGENSATAVVRSTDACEAALTPGRRGGGGPAQLLGRGKRWTAVG